MPELRPCSLVSLALACASVLVLPQMLLDTMSSVAASSQSPGLPPAFRGGPLLQEWGLIYLTTPASWATQF